MYAEINLNLYSHVFFIGSDTITNFIAYEVMFNDAVTQVSSAKLFSIEVYRNDLHSTPLHLMAFFEVYTHAEEAKSILSFSHYANLPLRA